MVHLYSEFCVQSDNMTSSHCHCHSVHVLSSSQVAKPTQVNHRSKSHLCINQLRSAVNRLAWRVTPDSGESARRCRVDDERSSAASRDGSTDYCIWGPDVLSATMEDFPLQALVVSAQFRDGLFYSGTRKIQNLLITCRASVSSLSDMLWVVSHSASGARVLAHSSVLFFVIFASFA